MLIYIAVEADELPNLVGALELAIEQYRKFADPKVATSPDNPRLNAAFKAQAESVERLRKRIGERHGY